MNDYTSLIFGTGRRIRSTILPSLKILNAADIFIKGRNLRKTQSIASEEDISCVENLSDDLISKIKIIFISVPSENILDILDQLKNYYTKDKILFIDTPIIGNLKNLNLLFIKNSYLKVLVAEDYIFSSIALNTKKIIHDNKLTFKKLKFLNNGYSYHSLAMGRMIDQNKKLFFSIKKNKTKPDYFFYLFWSKIFIINNNNIKNEELIYTDRLLIDNYTLSKNTKKHELIIIFENILDIKLYRKYEDNIERISSVSRMIINSIEEIEEEYSIKEGIYDSFVIKFLDKFHFFIDIPFRKSSLAIFLLSFISFFLYNKNNDRK